MICGTVQAWCQTIKFWTLKYASSLLCVSSTIPLLVHIMRLFFSHRQRWHRYVLEIKKYQILQTITGFHCRGLWQELACCWHFLNLKCIHQIEDDGLTMFEATRVEVCFYASSPPLSVCAKLRETCHRAASVLDSQDTETVILEDRSQTHSITCTAGWLQSVAFSWTLQCGRSSQRFEVRGQMPVHHCQHLTFLHTPSCWL